MGDLSSLPLPSAPGEFGSKVGSNDRAVVSVAGTTSLLVTCPALQEAELMLALKTGQVLSTAERAAKKPNDKAQQR